MKKFLLSFGVLISLSLNAQFFDTLANHFSGLTLIPSAGQGYISGNNDYGDIAKMQLFDASYGVYGPGQITNVLLAIPSKTRTFVGSTISVTIRQNDNGVPGQIIGMPFLVPLGSIDTSSNGFTYGSDFLYNVNGYIQLLNIPANGSFWAGIDLPETEGDSVALYTSDENFSDAITHTGEFWSDGTFHTFGDPNNWAKNVSLAIFPVVRFYVAPTYTVSCSSLPSNGGTTTGAGSYEHNESVNVSATANSGFAFVNWTVSGNVVSTSPTYSFPANANANLVANFAPTSSITENSTIGYSIFPNPVNDQFNFKLNEIVSIVEILTLDGKLISSNSFNAMSGSIDVAELKAGTYMYSIISLEGAKYNATFVKQ